MLLFKPLNFSLDVHFLVVFGLDLLLEIFFQFFQVFLVLVSVSLDFCLEVARFNLLSSLQLIILGTFLHYVLGLVGVKLLKPIFKLLLLRPDLFIKLFPQQVFLLDNCIVLLDEL